MTLIHPLQCIYYVVAIDNSINRSENWLIAAGSVIPVCAHVQLDGHSTQIIKVIQQRKY